MAAAGDIVKNFYDAAVARDVAKARTLLADDLVFVGLFKTYRGADDYIKTFTCLLQITTRFVKTIIAQADEAAVFFELETKAPAMGVVQVAEWHQIKNGKIAHVESAFAFAHLPQCSPADSLNPSKISRPIGGLFHSWKHWHLRLAPRH